MFTYLDMANGVPVWTRWADWPGHPAGGQSVAGAVPVLAAHGVGLSKTSVHFLTTGE